MNKMQELKRWLKRSLKKKVSINDKTVISFLMLGFLGFGVITESAWSDRKLKGDGANPKKLTVDFGDGEQKTGTGSVIFAEGSAINTALTNSVVVGYGTTNEKGQYMKIAVENEGATGIVALGAVRVLSNPFYETIPDKSDPDYRNYLAGRTGNGGQAVAIGNDVTSTSQAVAIGNNTFALGGSSIAIGNDDISTYRDKISDEDYNAYFKKLYDKIDSSHNRYGHGSDANAIFSPNVASGEGSISIGSRTVAYQPGSTALGTMAFALGKGATALGTQSRAEGEGAIAIGNKAINFANRALAIGNDTQILKEGGTAVGLRAKSGGGKVRLQ